MRKILYRNRVGIGNRKRELFVREEIATSEMIATIERRCTYYVRERVHVDDPNDLKALEGFKENNDTWKKKHFHILRDHGSCKGGDKLFCKAAGTFYVVVGNYIFCIAFVHSFKINVGVPTLHKQ